MKKKSKNPKLKKIEPKNNGTFCTECGDELQDFAFNEKAKNKNEIKEKHYNCIKTGKFSGEFCSKLFISDDSVIGDFLIHND
jgi:hypothetical protein